jgi:hypothetical protein
MTIAAPSMMGPEASAAGALYVSAENETFGNTFGGAQIVEVVVIGHQTDIALEKASEPTVKVNHKLLRMAQGADGNWYGYFGDSTFIVAADQDDNNLDFGLDVDPDNLATSDTGASNIYVNASQGVITNPPALSNWNNTVNTQSAAGTVLASYGIGSLGINDDNDHGQGNDREWPFIQLYDLTVGTFDVVYEQAGPDEVVSLDYDSGDLDDFAGMEIDRNAAAQGSHIHLTITDNQLNIDPTAKDIVIFYLETGSEGVSFTNGTTADDSSSDGAYSTANYRAYSNGFDDNGKLIINNNTNSASVDVLNATLTLDDVNADNHMVFWESA